MPKKAKKSRRPAGKACVKKGIKGWKYPGKKCSTSKHSRAIRTRTMLGECYTTQGLAGHRFKRWGSCYSDLHWDNTAIRSATTHAKSHATRRKVAGGIAAVVTNPVAVVATAASNAVTATAKVTTPEAAPASPFLFSLPGARVFLSVLNQPD